MLQSRKENGKVFFHILTHRLQSSKQQILCVMKAPAPFQKRAGEDFLVVFLSVGAVLHLLHFVLLHGEILTNRTEKLRRIITRDHNKAVGIAHQQITGHDHLPAADDGGR